MYFTWHFHLMFLSPVIPWILAMAKLVILLSPFSQQQHPLVLWGHYSSSRKWHPQALQMHLCSFSTLKKRGVGFFGFFFLSAVLFSSSHSVLQSSHDDTQGVIATVCAIKLRFESSRRTPGGQDPLKFSYLEFRLTSCCFLSRMEQTVPKVFSCVYAQSF